MAARPKNPGSLLADVQAMELLRSLLVRLRAESQDVFTELIDQVIEPEEIDGNIAWRMSADALARAYGDLDEHTIYDDM